MRFFVFLTALVLVGSVVFVVVLELFVSGGEAAQQSNLTPGPEDKELSGRVARTYPDTGMLGAFAVKNEATSQREVVPFKYRPDSVRVTLDGKEAKPDAISGGQKVTVEYLTKTNKKDREYNLAQSIELRSGSGAKRGGESTG
jgi:hypothetical protein